MTDIKEKIPAMMYINNGEKMAGLWRTGHIPGTGMYKILSKQKKDGTFEWVHFVQRDNGIKENVYRGEVDTKEKLLQVVDIMDKTISKVSGGKVKFEVGEYDMYTLGTTKFDKEIN